MLAVRRGIIRKSDMVIFALHLEIFNMIPYPAHPSPESMRTLIE